MKNLNEHLTASAACYAVIKASEGLQLRSYICPAGKWTVGYGHTLTAHRGMKITMADADRLLHDDVAVVEIAVKRLVKVALSQGQYDAVVSITFNIGIGHFSKSTLLKLLNAGNIADAAKEFGAWIYAGGVKCAGLIIRRGKERSIFEGKNLEVV